MALLKPYCVYKARFSSSRPPFDRLYIGCTHKPDLRPAELEHCNLGQQPKFFRPLVGAVRFEILHRGLTKPAAELMEAKVAAELSAHSLGAELKVRTKQLGDAQALAARSETQAVSTVKNKLHTAEQREKAKLVSSGAPTSSYTSSSV